MFRARLCSSSGGQIVLYRIWYRHTETREWFKITKIQFYKYRHIVVKVTYEFFGVITVYFFTISMLCHVEVTFIQLLNVLKMYYVYLHNIFVESI